MGIKNSWSKKVIDWIEGNTAFVSVPFTWELPQAYQRCAFLMSQGYTVRAGGPAVSLMPNYLADVAQIGGEVDALPHHNPNACFTSRGCIRRCPFCAVPIIEGQLRELDDWPRKPIVCDNNLLACSKAHFDKVVDSLKGLKGVDFNQGLDARLLTEYHANRLAELDCVLVRLAWDDVRLEKPVLGAIETLRAAGFPNEKIRVYVLIGFRDTPEDAQYRLETLQKMGIWPFPMRYHPLDALKPRGYVGEHWTEHKLRRFNRYWAKQAWLGWIPFEDYEHNLHRVPVPDGQLELEGVKDANTNN